MRPASASAQWHMRLSDPKIAAQIVAGVENLCVVEAANPEMEALAIAVAMREAREKNIPAALVTPDRALARAGDGRARPLESFVRRLRRDSLMDTQAGIFARLAAQAVADDLAPPTLLALVKHPCFGWARKPARMHRPSPILRSRCFAARDRREAARDFCEILRDLRTSTGKFHRRELSSLHRSEPRAALTVERLIAVQEFIDSLCAALEPLDAIRHGAAHDFSQLAVLHRKVIGSLSRDDNKRVIIFEGDGGEALDKAFVDLTVIGALSGLATTRGRVFRCVQNCIRATASCVGRRTPTPNFASTVRWKRASRKTSA